MRHLNVLPLSALRVIEAAGRAGSLTAAAAELGVTPGALSQRLRKAEEALGRPLFSRHPDGLTPTEALAEILPRLTRHMAGLDAAAGALRGSEPGVLTLSVAPVFASRWLIWRLHAFADAHPEIDLRLDPKVARIDLDAAGVDAAIRVATEPGAGVEAIHLVDQGLFPVCAPALAERIDTLDDLFRLPVIRENDALSGWQTWLAAQGRQADGLQPGPTYGDAALCLDAAMTGQGLFMGWETVAADAVARGTLAAPFPMRVASGQAFWFVTTAQSARKPAVRRFRDWLLAEMRRAQGDWDRVLGAELTGG
ncbi:LysR family transcriptional regulator [Rhodobacter sp. NTK016B]|uniref:LysR substrate-binding domain-containing protein n=1 Tax=Rhodobacter sp. NTK016B TaxID=2759676 RepID=UPI001A8F272A|nr:LysR substrate-binding domain-containing protein [Rhodobacter sp. NTK016B]MBN8290348.1 LysR family transcriptional regulator [Rhodobacter sp. NTK016B]